MSHYLTVRNWTGTTLPEVAELDKRIENAIANTSMSDGSIAAYFGVKLDKVRGMRSVAACAKPTRVRAHLNEFRAAGILRGGVDLNDRSEKAAKMASDALNKRIWAVYERVADERGLSGPLEAAVALGMRG